MLESVGADGGEQAEKNKKEPVVKALFEQTQVEDRRLKELLEGE